MADAILYYKFGDVAVTEGIFGSPVSEPMGSLEKVNAALAKCAPKVASIVRNFKECPAMKKYLADRPKGFF